MHGIVHLYGVKTETSSNKKIILDLRWSCWNDQAYCMWNGDSLILTVSLVLRPL